LTRIEHLKTIKLKIAELYDDVNISVFKRTFSNRIGIIYIEIDKNKGTAVVSYDDTKMSLFDINEAVTKMRFKLEGISYLS